MKLSKLLIVPAVLVLGVVTAVPAWAHSATIANLTATCNSDHKVCFAFDVTASDLDSQGRDVLVDLIDKQQNNKVLETKTEHLSPSTTNVRDCFDSSVLTSVNLTIRIRVPQGSDLDLGQSQTSVDTQGCVTSPSPSPSPSASPPTPTPQTPTPTASAAVTTTLAGTGGFDFRYLLVGLTALVAGLALLLVSASRGRSSTK